MFHPSCVRALPNASEMERNTNHLGQKHLVPHPLARQQASARIEARGLMKVPEQFSLTPLRNELADELISRSDHPISDDQRGWIPRRAVGTGGSIRPANTTAAAAIITAPPAAVTQGPISA